MILKTSTVLKLRILLKILNITYLHKQKNLGFGNEVLYSNWQSLTTLAQQNTSKTYRCSYCVTSWFLWIYSALIKDMHTTRANRSPHYSYFVRLELYTTTNSCEFISFSDPMANSHGV